MKPRGARPEAAGTPPPTGPWRAAGGPSPAGALLLLAAVLVAYWPALGAEYIWDDDAYVTHNPVLSEPGGLWRIWFEPGATIQYYPLVFTSFWLEHRVHGLSPPGCHLLNVLLHGLAAVLLWRAMARLAVPGAWLGAALFALHPVAAESVAWVTERKNVLSAVFTFAAMAAYCRFAALGAIGNGTAAGQPAATRQHGGPAGSWFAAMAFFACALLSKTAVCGLPVVLLLLLWRKRARLSRRNLVPLVPFFLLAGAMGLLTTWVERHHVGASEVDWQLSPLQRFHVAGRAVVFYLFKLAWPADLCFIYPRWQVSAAWGWETLAPAGVLAGLAMLWALRGGIGRGPLVALASFVVMVLPAAGLVDFYFMTYSFVADHFQYLAAAGPLALAGAGAVRATSRLASATGRRMIPALPLACLAALTFHRSAVFRNQETLWTDVLAKSPTARRQAHDNLAVYYAGLNRHVEAARHYRESLRILPEQPEVLSNLAISLSQTGQAGEAIAALREAVRLRPGHVQAQCNLGLLLAGSGRAADAERHYQEAIRLDPDFADARFNYGRLLAAQGRVAEAAGQYREALRINPEDAAARAQLEALSRASSRAGP
jgi:tetratricopeptide (TPR) repeat protein